MDIQDYINEGLVGKKVYVDTESLELNWNEAYTIYKAVRNVDHLALEQFVTNSYNIFIDEGPGSITKSIICINPEGQALFCDAVNNVYTKSFEVEKKAKLFWNCLITDDKLTGVVNYDGIVGESDTPKFRKYKLLTRNFLRFDFTLDYTTPVYDNNTTPVGTRLDLPYTLDFTNYQTLTPQIYKEYINSVTEYSLAIKKLVKTVTGSKI